MNEWMNEKMTTPSLSHYMHTKYARERERNLKSNQIDIKGDTNTYSHNPSILVNERAKESEWTKSDWKTTAKLNRQIKFLSSDTHSHIRKNKTYSQPHMHTDHSQNVLENHEFKNETFHHTNPIARKTTQNTRIHTNQTPDSQIVVEVVVVAVAVVVVSYRIISINREKNQI